MHLNTICPSYRSRKLSRRVGRGIGSGFGKTCGRGHKGQKSRSGGYHKTGFEGGQMPLQRRLPKRGFTSFDKKISSKQSVSIGIKEVLLLDETEIDLDLLRSRGVILDKSINVKIYLSSSVNKEINLKGISVTKGLKFAIEAAGGSVD